MEKAHKHVGEASKLLRELHADLPLNVFLRIADCAVRPLVILHIPKTEQLVQKLKETAINRQRRIMRGSATVVDVMLERNLPRCGDWTAEDEYRPRKMIASLVHKYIRDEMLKEQTTTATIVEEFGLAKTTIHRQIWGKKYAGGGQKLEKIREPTAKASGSGIERKKVAAVILKRNAETEKLAVEGEAPKEKKGKGKGKNSSGTARSAQDIRHGSTADEQKRKRQEKALEQEAEEIEGSRHANKRGDSSLKTSKKKHSYTLMGATRREVDNQHERKTENCARKWVHGRFEHYLSDFTTNR